MRREKTGVWITVKVKNRGRKSGGMEERRTKGRGDRWKGC